MQCLFVSKTLVDERHKVILPLTAVPARNCIVYVSANMVTLILCLLTYGQSVLFSMLSESGSRDKQCPLPANLVAEKEHQLVWGAAVLVGLAFMWIVSS